MATAGNTGGPQSYAFMPYGGTQAFTFAANSITTTLTLFNSVQPPAPEAAIVCVGTSGAANAAFITFDTATVNSSSAMPVPTIQTMSGINFPLTILRTGVRPRNVVQMSSLGTCTVYITPGEGSR